MSLWYTLNQGASLEAVSALRKQFPHLPDDYFSFLLQSDVAKVSLESTRAILRFGGLRKFHSFLRSTKCTTEPPRYVAVGSSGGGELYVFPVFGSPSGIF